jgi:DHA1 family bicyclomycin/chloramphenicol resistance-like MFS transporter
MVFIGSLLSVGAVSTQTALILAGHIGPLSFFAPGFLITFAQGLALSYAQAGAMATNLKLAGTAAGIGVFVQNFCGGLFAQIYGMIADGTAIPLTEMTSISSVLCLVAGTIPLVVALRRRRLAALKI